MKPAASVPVLMYHHVSPAVGSITTSPENFASQLRWLRRAGYRTLNADGLARFLAGEAVPHKSVVLTFDDGYLDNWVHAHPLLAQYGMTALMFVVSSWLQDGPVRACAGAGRIPATPDHAECKRRIAQGDTDSVIIRWSEAEAMQRAGTFEFHSHTHTHTRWDQQHADAAAKRSALAADLALARSTLVQRLGGVSAHLCWPQGYFDDDYQQVAGAAGFRYFYTTDARGLNLPHGNARHIHRVAVKNRGGLMFGQRVWLARDTRIGPLYNRWKR